MPSITQTEMVFIGSFVNKKEINAIELPIDLCHSRGGLGQCPGARHYRRPTSSKI